MGETRKRHCARRGDSAVSHHLYVLNRSRIVVVNPRIQGRRAGQAFARMGPRCPAGLPSNRESVTMASGYSDDRGFGVLNGVRHRRGVFVRMPISARSPVRMTQSGRLDQQAAECLGHTRPQAGPPGTLS